MFRKIPLQALRRLPLYYHDTHANNADKDDEYDLYGAQFLSNFSYDEVQLSMPPSVEGQNITVHGTFMAAFSVFMDEEFAEIMVVSCPLLLIVKS